MMQSVDDATKRKTAHSAVKSSMKIKNDEQHIACMYDVWSPAQVNSQNEQFQ